jgi:3-methyladenine DNA glycosylase AlkD
MPSTAEILQQLKLKAASPANLDGMARYGITVEKRFGISVTDLRRIAKEIGKDHKLAVDLWKSGIADARILASMIAVPEKITSEEMETWVSGFDSWDVCDQVCMNLFDKTAFARKKIAEWSIREEEYVKRAAFALIACLVSHDRHAPDKDFIGFLQIIKHAATDERNYVKKAVNWALRNIGKRNATLNKAAIKTAKEIQRIDSKAARWIAADAIRELESSAVQKRLQK